MKRNVNIVFKWSRRKEIIRERGMRRREKEEGDRTFFFKCWV